MLLFPLLLDNARSMVPGADFCWVGWQWGADVYAAMDEAFRDRFVPFWHKAFFLSELGLEVPATPTKFVFGG